MKTSHHARQRQRALAADGGDAGMRVWRAQHLEVQPASHGHVQRVAGVAGDDVLRERIRQAGTTGLARHVLFGRPDAVQGVVDGTVAGAPAQIALERTRQIRPLLVVQCSRGQDHAGRAEAALEGLGIEERLLHRVHGTVRGQSLDGRDRTPGSAEGRPQTGMDRHAVDPDRAGAAIAGVAALLDPEAALLPQKGAQALPGSRLGGDRLAVDGEIHAAASGSASSARICSAW